MRVKMRCQGCGGAGSATFGSPGRPIWCTCVGFGTWLDTFLSEKQIDGEDVLEIEGPSGTNWMPIAVLVEIMKSAPTHEQKGIKDMLVKIDFANADVRGYLKHLATAVAR